jgi:hypothetical protein
LGICRARLVDASESVSRLAPSAEHPAPAALFSHPLGLIGHIITSINTCSDARSSHLLLPFDQALGNVRNAAEIHSREATPEGAMACIGTAVVLYRVVKRQNEGVALGFVGARVLEAAAIFAGVVSLLSVVTLRQAGAGADALVTGQALVALHNWTTLLGQGFLPAVNALLLGSLLYRSRLVPRIIPLVGLIGAPLLVVSDIATLFGLKEPVSALSALAALPIALWEFSLGIYLIVKGFKPSPITAGMVAADTRPVYQDAAI